MTGPAHDEPPFSFAHDPSAARADAPFTWCGHVHPAASLRARADRLKLPCFWIGPRIGVLPAFSRFTSGASVSPAPGERLVAVTPEGLLPLGERRGGGRGLTTL
ncbi:hypothetical protein J4558_15415 [Leptolyngbya sp. 15MV]|nr:hypothetical protein J4558_15415 [Leptolyngbya sp. 15MV]